MKKVTYIRCPRCELNYIEKKEKLCSVCKAELSAHKDEFVGDLDLELCPICKTNYIQPDEIMCASCLRDHQADDEDVNTDWDDYLSRDEEEIVYDDEETGDMASVTDIDSVDSGLDDDLDTGIGFDDTIEDIDVDEEFGDDDDDSDDELDDEIDEDDLGDLDEFDDDDEDDDEDEEDDDDDF